MIHIISELWRNLVRSCGFKEVLGNCSAAQKRTTGPQGERQGTPCVCRQSITGPHRDKRDTQPCTLTPWDNLESPINQTCMFLCTWREPMHARGKNMQAPYRKATAETRTKNPLAVIFECCPFYFLTVSIHHTSIIM